ncbi:MAG: LysM domain-containing protein [Clostridia bacterium]|nr:LysM domain-containing protein [Clostridia bacterium]
MLAHAVRAGDTLLQLALHYGTTMEGILAANPTVDFHNVASGQVIAIPQIAAPEHIAAEAVPVAAPAAVMTRAALHDALRSLWEQHVMWTRLAIISAAAGLPDMNLTVARLLRNASDMEAALRPFYGDAAAAQFGSLIKNHLLIALQLVSAAKAGNTQAAQEAERQWYANADAIAEALSTMNPYISKEEFRRMLYNHLAMTKAEAVARLSGDFANDIRLYDSIEQQALSMADMMSDAIARQFSLSA